MKRLQSFKIIFSLLIMAAIMPLVTMAQPATPGDGTDPFAAPVNGGLVFVVVIAFLFGVYRIYRLKGKTTIHRGNN